MTRDEFDKGYAARSNCSTGTLRSMGLEPRPCVCGDESCEGWQMAHVAESERFGYEWPEFSPYPSDDPRFGRLWYLTFVPETEAEPCELCTLGAMVSIGMDPGQASHTLTENIVRTQQVITCEHHEQVVRDKLTASLLERGIVVPDA